MKNDRTLALRQNRTKSCFQNEKTDRLSLKSCYQPEQSQRTKHGNYMGHNSHIRTVSVKLFHLLLALVLFVLLRIAWKIQTGDNGQQSKSSMPPTVLPNSYWIDAVNDIDDDPDRVPIYQPRNASCLHTDGIYHIAMGDIGGAAGTIFFQFVIGQILYAERYNLTPWVHLNNVSHIVFDPNVHTRRRNNNDHDADSDQYVELQNMIIGYNASYDKPYGRSGHWRDARPGEPVVWDKNSIRTETLVFNTTDGIWNHYFRPVSSFVPGDVSCIGKKYVTLDLYLITPGIHGFSNDFATRCWRYQYLPDYVTKPHVPVTQWLQPQRLKANRVVRQYIQFRPFLVKAANRVNPNCNINTTPCLGLHIRHSDKAAGRRLVQLHEFLPFVETYLNVTSSLQRMGYIYIATDSTKLLKDIDALWPLGIRKRIRTIGPDIIRSSNDTPVFNISDSVSHHRTNMEVLTEILALSYCQFMVHGFSAVSESSIWINYDLHRASVNLEDSDHLNASVQFEGLVRSVLMNRDQSTWPRPLQTKDIWPDLFEQIEFPPTSLQLRSTIQHTNSAPTGILDGIETDSKDLCAGYVGVLHISGVGSQDSAGAAFFTSILNQLLFAVKFNLLPWIHLQPGLYSSLIYDDRIHTESSISFRMQNGMAVSVKHLQTTNIPTNETKFIYPDAPAQRTPMLQSYTYIVNGTGIWNNYFEPVSAFVPGSCPNAPLISMEPILVSPGLDAFAPWAVRAWQYDNVPNQLWKQSDQSLKDFYYPMRNNASQIVSKYYKFRGYIVRRALEVNPLIPVGTTDEIDTRICLGIHLRNSDKKGTYRAKIEAKYFTEYIESYANAGGQVVYLATDSNRAFQYIGTFIETWNSNASEAGRKTPIILHSQGKYVVRSHKKEYPAHFLEQRHQVNSEVLVDILALSYCQLLIHTYSTVSEAAIYLNPSLHENSVNLEDTNKITSKQFEDLVVNVLRSKKKTHTKN